MAKKLIYTRTIRRLDPLGRIVIPKKFRDHCSMKNSDDVEITLEGSTISVRKYNARCKFCGEMSNLTEFKGSHICPACMLGLKRLNSRND